MPLFIQIDNHIIGLSNILRIDLQANVFDGDSGNITKGVKIFFNSNESYSSPGVPSSPTAVKPIMLDLSGEQANRVRNFFDGLSDKQMKKL